MSYHVLNIKNRRSPAAVGLTDSTATRKIQRANQWKNNPRKLPKITINRKGKHKVNPKQNVYQPEQQTKKFYSAAQKNLQRYLNYKCF